MYGYNPFQARKEELLNNIPVDAARLPVKESFTGDVLDKPLSDDYKKALKDMLAWAEEAKKNFMVPSEVGEVKNKLTVGGLINQIFALKTNQTAPEDYKLALSDLIKWYAQHDSEADVVPFVDFLKAKISAK